MGEGSKPALRPGFVWTWFQRNANVSRQSLQNQDWTKAGDRLRASVLKQSSDRPRKTSSPGYSASSRLGLNLHICPGRLVYPPETVSVDYVASYPSQTIPVTLRNLIDPLKTSDGRQGAKSGLVLLQNTEQKMVQNYRNIHFLHSTFVKKIREFTRLAVDRCA